MKEKDPLVIGIYGKARHGKNTFADFYEEYAKKDNQEVIITSIAKYIKYYAREMTDWDGNEETKPREFLQTFGTEVVRKSLNKPDFFTKRILEDIEIFAYFYDVILIPDVRLLSEIEALRNTKYKTIIIKVERPNFISNLSQSQSKHQTEVDLDNYQEYDYKATNTTLEAYKKEVLTIYNDIKIKENK